MSDKKSDIRKKIEKQLLKSKNLFGKKNKIFSQDDIFYKNCGLRVDFLDLVTGSQGKLKKVTRYMLNGKDCEPTIEKIKKLGLYHLELGLLLRRSADNGLFQSTKDNKISGEYQRIIYVSPDKKRIESIKKLEEKIFSGEKLSPKDIRDITERIGKLFEYPKCCIRFFAGYISFTTPELNFRLLRESKAFLWQLNNLDGKINLFPHIPCRYDCQKSADFAEKSFELVREQKGEDVAKRMKKYLRSPFLYFKSGRFIRLEGYLRKKVFHCERTYCFEPENIIRKYSKEKKVFLKILRNIKRSGKIIERRKNILVVGKKNETLLELDKFKDWCAYARFI
ncbi:MAG: hypothetical protein Q8L09_00220 [Candidatus Moranbacteria bacterium]|nr:hypothetical protein [Candidatus Moranbacteria bacterium]